MTVLVPARCTSDLPNEFREYHVAEPKIDGSRYLFYIGNDPTGRHEGNTLLSRHISKVDNLPVDKTGHVRDLKNPILGLTGTVLDGEVFFDNFTYTQSILNCSTANAIERQKTEGRLKYHVFDCRVFRGEDISGLPLSKRRQVAEAVVKHTHLDSVSLVPQWPFDRIQEMFNLIVEAGGEGVIVKDTRMAYGVGWAKMKKSYEISCFISGYKPGNGKYSDSIGAIAVSIYNDGKPVEIGFASGFSDAVRSEMNKNRDKFLGRIVDVYAHELSAGLRLRHPTFLRFRDDYDRVDCTLVRAKEVFKQSAKSRRIR